MSAHDKFTYEHVSFKLIYNIIIFPHIYMENLNSTLINMLLLYYCILNAFRGYNILSSYRFSNLFPCHSPKLMSLLYFSVLHSLLAIMIN